MHYLLSSFLHLIKGRNIIDFILYTSLIYILRCSKEVLVVTCISLTAIPLSAKMHALKCCINEASLCFCHGAVFIRLFSEDQSSKYSSTEKTKNEEFTFSKDKRPSSTVTMVLQMSGPYEIEIHRR